MTSTVSAGGSRQYGPLLGLIVPLTVLVWAYWTTFHDLARVWAANPSYSHGFLVLLFAIFLLWFRRDLVEPDNLRPNYFGFPVLALSVAMRFGGPVFSHLWLDLLSLIPAVAGVFLLVGGVHGLRWAWPTSLFLFFLVPLPVGLMNLLSGLLQQVATLGSTSLMQCVGVESSPVGKVVLGDDSGSGLRLLMVFLALSSAIVLIIKRSGLQKSILLVSAVPISIGVNILRISATGILHEMVKSETLNGFFHDVAGWFMMPCALVLLWCEDKLMIILVASRSPSLKLRTSVKYPELDGRDERASPDLLTSPQGPVRNTAKSTLGRSTALTGI